MKILFLCVDRDDDLGAKAGVPSPVVGRRKNLEAALALGLADPEDSDTNAILAAVHLYDRELQTAQAVGDQVEVATITGHRSMGLKGDRKLAAELDEVLAATRPDQVVLVSDGAEDERIMPILTSRTRVVHVHRSIVKQAPRLEGAFYTLSRILDEPKQARRFVLPIALLMLFWGSMTLLGHWQWALGGTLAFVGAWLLVHAMQWESHVGRVFADIGTTVRRGRIAVFANLLLVAMVALGALLVYEQRPWQPPGWDDPCIGVEPSAACPVPVARPEPYGRGLQVLLFLQDFFPYVLIGFLLHSVGLLLDAWARGGRSGFGPWMAIIALIALGFIANVLFEVAVSFARDEPIASVLDFDTVLRLMIGGLIAFGGLLLGRYLRSFAQTSRA
jgi:hypothetical protein